MLRVKICGITRRDDALRACDLGADAIGFIFFDKSPRCISAAAAAAIAEALPVHVARVGVFVDADSAAIAAVVQHVGLDVVQFHGAYRPRQMAGLHRVRKVVVARVHPEFDFAGLAVFQNLVDAFLLDTHRQGRFGGTGEPFDWHLAQRAAVFGRVILAGGLAPDNVARAVRTAQPYGLDVNSGVEASPGKKDRDKLTELFANIKEFRRGWIPATPRPFPLA